MIALHHLKAYRIQRNERGKGWFKKERKATVIFLVVLFFLVPYQTTHRGEGSPAGTTRNKLFLVRQLMPSQRLTARKWFVTLATFVGVGVCCGMFSQCHSRSEFPLAHSAPYIPTSPLVPPRFFSLWHWLAAGRTNEQCFVFMDFICVCGWA